MMWLWFRNDRMGHFLVVVLVVVALSVLHSTAWLCAIIISFFLGFHFISRWVLVRSKYSAYKNAFFSIESDSSHKKKWPTVELLPNLHNKDRLLRPWEVLVTPNVSDSLAELMEEIIVKFIQPWYSLISADLKFSAECRASLRHASGSW